jgi:hypothetical protein
MRLKTDELIKRGHETAKGLPASTAELMKELATRLDASMAATRQACEERRAFATEAAYLMPKAASELSRSWVLQKYWVGISVALMHIRAGRLSDAVAWLEGTVDGPGLEVPELSDMHEIELWATEQQKNSISHSQALEIITAAVPATESFIADVTAKGRTEGINFAASRLAAAFNHGFVDKPMTEVGDVVRMILDAKADLANDPIPPADGLSGEYAEQSLQDWEEQLRGGRAVVPELKPANLINKFYKRYPFETFKSDSERSEALGYFIAGAELQCFGGFVKYEDLYGDE